MDTHQNARLTPKGREAMVRAVLDGGLSKAAAARQFNTSVKTVSKGVDHFLTQGAGGLRDRSSRRVREKSG
jgi:transposase-like protein